MSRPVGRTMGVMSALAAAVAGGVLLGPSAQAGPYQWVLGH
jgi:uncharacterized protein with LGFP repeats